MTQTPPPVLAPPMPNAAPHALCLPHWDHASHGLFLSMPGLFFFFTLCILNNSKAYKEMILPILK